MEIATRILNHTDVMMSLLGILPPFLPKSINKFRTFIQDKMKGGVSSDQDMFLTKEVYS